MEKQLTLRRKYINIILTLIAISVMPLYLYGEIVIPLFITAIVTAVVVDYLCIRLAGKKGFAKDDYSSIITAFVTVLLLPATVPSWVVAVSVSIGLIIAKHPFGGAGNNIFNPAAVGLAFVAICWPEYVLRYPVPFSTIKGIDNLSLIQYTSSPASILKVNGTPKFSLLEALLGQFAGPMGATCIIVLSACALYLFSRKIISLRIIVSATIVVGIFAIFFQRVPTGTIHSLTYEFSSGALLFGLIYIANDPTSIPKTKAGQILFGLILGAIIMLFRYFGAVEFEFVYAILLANIFAIPCDRYASFVYKKLNKISMPYEKGKNYALVDEPIKRVEEPKQEPKQRLIMVDDLNEISETNEKAAIQTNKTEKSDNDKKAKSKTNAKNTK